MEASMKMYQLLAVTSSGISAGMAHEDDKSAFSWNFCRLEGGETVKISKEL